MIDLFSSSSLPISYDPNSDRFIFTDALRCNQYKKIELRKLIPALLNKTLKYPELVYSETEEIYFQDDAEIFASNPVKYEVIVLPPGLLGIEFIKSHIYYTQEEKGKYSCIVECLSGILTVIIQKNKQKDEFDFETSIKEGILITLRKGEKIAIPTGYYYTFINSRNRPVIFSRVFHHKGIIDYSSLKREQGLGYFAIRKNARAEIVYNPRYRNIPALVRYTPGCDKFQPDCSQKCLYESFKQNMNYFIDVLI